MKKLLCLALMIIIAMSFGIFSVYAETVASGYCGAEGKNLSWVLDDAGTLTISGTGEMNDYSYTSSPISVASWHTHRSSITSVIVSEGVTSLGNNCFYNFSNLAEVILADSVKSIGNYSFSGLNITEITLPENLEYIGNYAFEATKLETITFPGKLKTIGNEVFYNCMRLKSVNFDVPSSLEAIGDYSFMNCARLSEFTIPASLNKIGIAAFSRCTALSDILLENENPTFRLIDGMLYDMTTKTLITCVNNGETELTVLDGTEIIAPYAFTNATSVTKLTIPNSVKRIHEYALHLLNNLEELTIPFVGERRGISGTQNAVFGCVFGTLGVFGEASFTEGVVQRYDYLSSKEGIVGCFIPPTIRTVNITDETIIPYGAFYNASMLTSVTLPRTLKKIQNNAFYNCTAKIDYEGTEAAWKRIGAGFLPHSYTDEILVTPNPTISVTDTEGGKQAEISCEENSYIYYTRDGSEPTYKSSVYSKPLLFDSVGTYDLKVISAHPGYDESQIVTESITVEKVPAPISSLASGAIDKNTEITLSCELDGAEIYYTLDNSEPTVSSAKYVEPILITDYVWIKAIAVKDGCVHSDISVYNYTREYTMPVVETFEASMVSKNSAVFSGNIENTEELGNYSIYFVYYEKAIPDVTYTLTPDSYFTATVEGLKEDTEYCYFIKVINGDKTANGNIVEFKTKTYEIPQYVLLSRDGARVQVGRSYKLYADILPDTALNKNIIWSSSDEEIATVDMNGTVQTIKEGTVIITAMSEDSRVYDDCTIVIVDKYATGEYDFSELNVVTNTRMFDPYGLFIESQGGQNHCALSYFARWDGVVLEEKDEYFPSYASPENGYSLENYYIEVDADFHLQNAYIIPSRNDSLDNDEIKNAIMKYGAVSAPMYVDAYFFSGSNNENYYYYGDYIGTGGHAITLIGWNDNYPATKFSPTPPGDGAFIAKNSWGTGKNSGEDGFFYISYYDTMLCRYDTSYVFPELETKNNYNTIWQYDHIGPSNKIGYEKATYAANVFPVSGKVLEHDELLKAVSFYTIAQDMLYEIYVIENYEDISSLTLNGKPVISGKLHEMGYHTIELDEDTLLSAGTRFGIVVKLISSDDSERAHMMLEVPVAEFAMANGNKNESFLSPDGILWTDIASHINKANVCIKAFTDFADIDKAVETSKAVFGKGINDESYVEIDIESSEDFTVVGVFDDFNFTHPEWRVETFKSEYETDATLPETYDLRELGQVTPVRNQGGFGTCWAFAAIASLESGVLKSGLAEEDPGVPDDPQVPDEPDTPDVPETEISLIYGDVSGDRKVDVIDAIIVLKYIVIGDESRFTQEQKRLADVNDDGIVDVLDVIRTLKHITIPDAIILGPKGMFQFFKKYGEGTADVNSKWFEKPLTELPELEW